ncbi:MAG TPA: NHL repeat-containing protein [Pyrinomonadaceae bacterium]
MRNTSYIDPRLQSRTRRRTITLIALALFFFVAGGALACFLYLRPWREKPKLTVFGQRPVVSTLTGTGAPGFNDGQLNQARFADPFGIVVDSKGNMYVADAGENNRIRKVTPEGIVATIAGSDEGFKDGQGASARFNTPSALALDAHDNLYVADTGNNAIRKITPEGMVTTIAGGGNAGFQDGPADDARFNAPVGVAVDAQGNVYVADTYNDRIRLITTYGQVATIAGGASPGYLDGAALNASFDTPCGLAIAPTGELYIADTGNNAIRKLTSEGVVTTFASAAAQTNDQSLLFAPVGLALTHDRFLYATANDRGRIAQISPDGKVFAFAGAGSGFNDGDGETARFNSPTGIAVDKRGALYVADSANYLVRKLTSVEDAKESNAAKAAQRPVINGVLPRLTAETVGVKEFPWPVDPQRQWHEMTATLGEVRGNYDGESRDHLHSGIDIQGPYGATVRAVYEEKVSDPLGNWGFGDLGEGLHVGLMTYVHMRVGRNLQDKPFDDQRFIPVLNEENKTARIRVRRGTRFHVGDALGTINRMYHVHLNYGPSGAQANPLALPFINFSDRVSPRIERDGIRLFNQAGERFTEMRGGRLIVRGDVSIVVEAYDQVDGNAARRRLGLYKLGYQILRADGTPAPGFEEPRINIEFNRLPPVRDGVRIAYADASGITVYGSSTTRFLYVVTNIVRDGRAATGVWQASELPAGDYILRIFAADYSGNEVSSGRDLPLSIER